MPSRRSNGEGSYYQYKRTGRWCGQIMVNGVRETFYADTKAEVVAQCQAYAAKARKQLPGPRSHGTFGAYLMQWFTMQAPTMPAGTQRTYRWAVQRVPDELASIPLAKLRRDHVQDAMRLVAEDLKPASLRVVRAVIHRSLSDAVDLGILQNNPSDRIRLIKADRAEAASWTLEEALGFLDVIGGHHWEALWWTVLSTGLRNGEVRALRWEDINLRTGAINVRRKLDEPARVVSQPKQHRIRTVVLDGPALESMRQHHVGTSGGYLFTKEAHQPLTGSNLRAEFYRLRILAEVSPIKFHSLRHTAITLMLQAGIPLHVVSKIAGHAHPSITTDIYAHVQTGDMAAAATTVSGVFAGRPERIREA